MRRKTLRIIAVGITIFVTTFDSTTAFGLFGGFRGGFRSGGNCGSSYSSGCSSWGSSGSGRVVYRSSSWSNCGGCGGSSDCGGGCSGCGSSSYSGGGVVEHATPDGVYIPQQPARVNKPSESTSVPRLQPDTMMQTPAGADTESMRGMPRSTTERTLPPGGETFAPVTPEKGPGTQPGTTQTDAFDFGPARSTTAPTTSGAPPAGAAPTTPTTPTTPSGFGDLFPDMPAGGASAPTTPPAGGGAAPAGGGAAPPGGATDTKSADPLENLFGPGTGGGATTPPAGGGATPIDPFKSSAILREDGGLASDSNREWVDNTGRFTTRGRLVSFLDGQVRLLKDNGRTTTVPLARLSENDLEFVNRQASAQRAIQVAERATSEVGTPLAAN